MSYVKTNSSFRKYPVTHAHQIDESLQARKWFSSCILVIGAFGLHTHSCGTFHGWRTEVWKEVCISPSFTLS
jgi:hypothetical protein